MNNTFTKKITVSILAIFSSVHLSSSEPSKNSYEYTQYKLSSLLGTLHSDPQKEQDVNDAVNFLEDIQNNPKTAFQEDLSHEKLIIKGLIQNKADELFNYLEDIKKNIKNIDPTEKDYLKTLGFIACKLKNKTVQPYLALVELQSYFKKQEDKNNIFPTFEAYNKSKNLSTIDKNLAKTSNYVSPQNYYYLRFNNKNMGEIFNRFKLYQTQTEILLNNTWLHNVDRKTLFERLDFKKEKERVIDTLCGSQETILDYALHKAFVIYNPTKGNYNEQLRKSLEKFYKFVENALSTEIQATHDNAISEVKKYSNYYAFLTLKQLPKDEKLSVIKQYLEQYYNDEFYAI